MGGAERTGGMMVTQNPPASQEGPQDPSTLLSLPPGPAWARVGQLAPFPCHLPSATSGTAIISR